MKSVTIYTTPTCAFCHMAKEFLKSKHVDFAEIDVTTNFEGMNWVLNATGQSGVPVLHIGEQIIIGFDRPSIEESLKKIHL